EFNEFLVAHPELPVLAVLGEPRVCKRLQRIGVGYSLRRAFDDNVLARVPAIDAGGPGRQRDLLVGVEVALLLLIRTGAEGESPVTPDSDERNSVRATVSADRDDPKQ